MAISDPVILTATISSGNSVSDAVYIGSGNKTEIRSTDLPDFDIPHRDTPIIFAASAISSNASVTYTARLREEW
jgi:hypothetical protein